jgi:hypothetical protein
MWWMEFCRAIPPVADGANSIPARLMESPLWLLRWYRILRCVVRAGKIEPSVQAVLGIGYDGPGSQ